MMSILGVVVLPAAIAIFLAITHLWFGDRRYKKGAKDGHALGYAMGRKDADNWWIGVEAETDRARQQIWRKEA